MSYLNYSDAVLNTPSFAIICMNKFGIIKEFNLGAEQIFGYFGDEIIGQKVNILMPEPHSQNHDDYVLQYLKTGQEKVIGSVREATAKRKNGEIFPIELRVNPFYIQEEIFFIGYILDISYRKELEEHDSIFQSIIENSLYGIVTIDLNNIITFWNKGAKSITGYTEIEKIATNLLETFSDLELSDKNKKQILEGTLTKNNGVTIYISISISVIYDKNQHIIGNSIIFHNISARKKFIADLQESETLFRTVIDSSSTSYVLYDEDNGFIDYVNPAFVNYFGCRVPTINEWWNIAFSDPVYREKIATEWMSRMQWTLQNTDSSFEPMEIKTIDKNGKLKWFFVEATALKGMQTKTQLVTLHDITEIKKTSKALEESEFRWKFALEGAGDGLWDWHIPSEKVFFSKRWKEMLGFAEHEIGNSLKEWEHRVFPDDAKEVLRVLQNYLDGKTSVYSCEHRIFCKDGSYKWVLDRGVAVSRDENGKPLRMIGTHTDIHERKVIEHKNQQLLSIIEKSVDFVGLLDAKTLTFNYLNCEAKNMIGLESDSSVENLTLDEIFTVKEQETLFKICFPIAVSRGVWQGNSFLIKKDNVQYPVSLILMANFDSKSDQPSVFSLIMKDISAQRNLERIIIKAKEEAENLASSKSEFLANMSHEIRTPINAILGMAYLLNKKELSQDEQLLTGNILQSGKLLLGIINDILDISKIESGHFELNHTAFELDLILDNLATIMTFNSAEKNITPIILPSYILKNYLLLGDELRLQQILVNLVSNAIKFTHKGYVLVSIELIKKTDNRIHLRFAVEDTGIGISPEHKEKIFNSFSQADTSITRNYGGTGLGLTISRHLVQLMGGEFLLESEQGKGSTFSFIVDFGYKNKNEITTPEKATHVFIETKNELELKAVREIVLSLNLKPFVRDENSDIYQFIQNNTCEILIIDTQTLDEFNLHHFFIHKQNKVIVLQTEYERTYFAQPDLKNQNIYFIKKPLTPSVLEKNLFAEKKSQLLIENKRLANLKLLIVDDNDINLEVARRIFSDEGAEIITLTNGLEAFEWLTHNPTGVDLVLMDIQMPVMDGCEATNYIRQIPELKNLPIIALSAGVLKSQMDRAQSAGLHDFITKPFNVDVAVKQICNALKIKTMPNLSTPIIKESSELLDENKVVEITKCLKFAGLDIEFALEDWKEASIYKMYLAQFLNDYEADIENIEQFSLPDMAEFAHKIKGAARVLGLFDLGNDAEELEELADEEGDVSLVIQNLKSKMKIAHLSITQYIES
jgi:PAS domain S-box-containing protein